MQYLAYEKTEASPNIIVDGKANQATVLALSHWRDSGTPMELRADLSAEIVFNYLDRPDMHVDVEYASNNHFDEDGLVGLYALLNPEDALEQREMLIDIASAGDFGKYRDRDAARVSFVLQAWQDPERSPLKKELFDQSYLHTTAVLYEELLPRLAKIILKIDNFEPYWSKEDELLTQTEEALSRGDIQISEIEELDLAVVSTYGVAPCDEWPQNIHRFPIHNATDRLRILLLSERKFELYYRYETWVELNSRATTPRIDLTHLAAELTKSESHGSWRFSGCDALSPRLTYKGAEHSKLTALAFQEKITKRLGECCNAANAGS